MNGVTAFATSAVPIVIGLVFVCTETALPTRYAPLVSLLLGIGAGFVAEHQAAHYDWVLALQIGITIGLAASGTYAGVKTVTAPKPPGSSPTPPPIL